MSSSGQRASSLFSRSVAFSSRWPGWLKLQAQITGFPGGLWVDDPTEASWVSGRVDLTLPTVSAEDRSLLARRRAQAERNQPDA